MRVAVDNGNGCMCDICGELVHPRMAFKLKIVNLDSDDKKARTGGYQVHYHADLCRYCLEKVKDLFKKEERK